MAGGYTVGIASETKAFRQGVESGIIDPLEDAQKELLDLGRSRGPEQLEQSMKDAEQATEKLDDEVKRTARNIEEEFRDAYRKVKRSADDAGDGGAQSMGKLRDGAQEVTQEMGQNLGEAVSSIRGDLSDLGQVGQDTLGGLAATLAGGGPAGIAGAAALAAGAVGLGLVTAEIEAQNEKVKALKETFADAWKAAIDGGKDYIDTATIASQISEIGFGEDWADERARAMEVEKATGLDLQLIYRALAGDMSAIEEVSSVLTEAEKDRNRAIKETLDGSRELSSEEANRIREQHDAIVGLNKDIDTVKDAYSETAAQAKVTADAQSAYWQSVIADAGTASEEVDEFGNKLYTLPDDTQVLIKAETGQATNDVSDFKGDVDGIPRTVNTRATFSSGSAQQSINRFIAQNNGRTIKLNGRFEIRGDV